MFDKTDKNNVVIFGLSASKAFSDKICQHLNVKNGVILITRFADGETNIQLGTSVRGKEVYVIQSTSPPVNENLMELLITIDALKRASASKIHAVIPYFGYARQDRKMAGRQPISAKLVANLLTTAGINRLMTVDIHSAQQQGFFDLPVDDLRATQELAKYVIKNIVGDLVVVSPDHGGVTRARKLAEYLQAPIAIVDKKRPAPNIVEVKYILGDVKNKTVIIIDDMIDTGGTIIEAAKAIKKHEAKAIYILSSHGLFSGKAIEKLTAAYRAKIIDQVIVTDTIDNRKSNDLEWLQIVSISKFLGKMISASIENRSLSVIFVHSKEEILDLL